MKPIRTCEYCHKSIEHRNKSARTCNDTCRKYASEVRHQKREPISDPNESIVEVSKTDMIKFNDELNTLESEILSLDKQYQSMTNKIDSIEKKSVYIFRRKLKEYESINLNALSEEEHDKLLKDKQSWELSLNKAKRFNQTKKNEKDKIIKDRHDIFLQCFRIMDKRNRLIREYLFNGGRIESNQIKHFKNTQTKYPFDKIDISYFTALGSPKKPFISMIYGSPVSGKTMLSILLSIELVKYFDAKVLFVVDSENLDSAIEYLSEITPNHNFTLKPAETYRQIDEELSKDDFEFIFIDSNVTFNLSTANIKTLQVKNPDLSIFYTMDKEKESLISMCDIVFETDFLKPSLDPLVVNCYAKIFLKDSRDKENEVVIFRNSEIEGFRMGLE